MSLYESKVNMNNDLWPSTAMNCENELLALSALNQTQSSSTKNTCIQTVVAHKQDAI